ncbi:aldehyde dehydrogenase family protein [Jannaschia sp. 2305UL9-9]|uniref:aldehyde dehydrogenase family protein n=1 Tax=Jannaschia sp. 2305UL9-9 TaxID=3121638 RepID=UPI003528DB96
MLDAILSTGTVTAQAQFIGGDWVPAGPRDVIEVDNPANEAIIATIPDGTPEDAAAAIEAAAAAQPAWAALPAIERAGWVRRLAAAIEADADALARIITAEQGKPLDQAHGEVGATLTFLTHAAESARRIEGEIITSDNRNEEIQIRRHPYGVVVGLTAWNYPMALAARKLGPALIAGNTFVLLGHEITPLSGLALAKLAEKVGLPRGVFNVVTGRGPVVGQTMVEHARTAMVTMTGSTRAGQQIFRAGAEGLKVLRLELGGKAPFIVMPGADMDRAVAAAVTARYTNCGQICTCNERMYLHDSLAQEFLEKFTAASAALTVGDPMGKVDIGPKVSRLEVDKVADMVAQARDAGAQVLLEGGPLRDGDHARGHWYAPTVLEVTDNAAPTMQQEVFGPVATAMRVGSFDEAIACANDTAYGLSAYLWSGDARQLARAPHELKFGELYINRANGEAVQGFHTGWGHSGLGGEDGRHGFDGYLRKQTTYNFWG